ncbi:MAG: DEAD/DEAH box helicase family protein [Nanoarchaeota archaeon]|nr:DEAD/DEAH box helicase family protein [Nanoarchaeota archaeon]
MDEKIKKYLKEIEPREYQWKIFDTCKNKNCLVILPTGTGKTLIALMLTIERMIKFPDKKILFLAPTRPLAEQHLNYFKKNLPELFATMELFTGKTPAEKRKKLWQNAEIIFSTPQCIRNDLKNNFYNLNDVSLLIEDECHRCVKNYSYTYIAEKYKQQSENSRILGLTASPGSEASKIKEICWNLSIEEVELRTRDSDDVKQYLQELKFEKVIVNFPPELEEIRHVLKELFNRYVEELRYRKVLFGPCSKTLLIALQKKIMATLARGNKNWNYMLGASACAQAIKLQHALELLETQTLSSFNKYLKKLFEQAVKKQSKGVVKLVAKPEFNFIYMTSNELLSKNIEHPKLEKLVEIVKQENSK